MNDPQDSSLQRRVEQLEATVSELQHLIGKVNRALADQGVISTEAEAVPEVPDPNWTESPPLGPPQTSPLPPQSLQKVISATSQTPDLLGWNIEYWLNRIGIGLLLLGVAFLFKYSVDQGWLTPTVRVGFGLGLGATLLVMGLRLHRVRGPFSQVLLGGSIATFYITGFAAFQLFALVAYAIAFGFMTGVTLLAFWLSVRQNQAVLSVIGVAGGLGTPFLLETGTGSSAGLVGYTCLVLAGSSAIYLVQGWRSLLWTSFVGSWAVFSAAASGADAGSDRWVVQVGLIFGWLAFWALPILRYVLLAQPRSRRRLLGNVSRNTRKLERSHVHVLSMLTPLVALGFSTLVWPLSEPAWGWVILASAIFYALIAGGLRRWPASRQLAYTHTLVAFVLLAIALALLLQGDTLFLALAVEATGLHFMAQRLSNRSIAITGHLLFVGLGLWLLQRLLTSVSGMAIANPRALTDLAVIGLGVAASTRLKWRGEVQIYGFIVHLAFLGWLWRELSILTNGNGFVTVAWGIYGATLLIIGLQRDLAHFRLFGLGTLLLVVAKLFLVDLTALEAIWRILLFLGFGGLFLFLSYYFRALWKPASNPTRRSD